MYAIYADGVCIYNDVFALENMKAISPKLTLEDNRAGSLTVTIPKVNVAYDTIEQLTTDISVFKDGKEIWAGRVLNESIDFWNNRVLYCEGELAFFNDTTQPPAEYPGISIRDYMERLIEIHNAKVAPNRQFKIGAVTVVDEKFPTYYTDYDKTISVLNALVEAYGGHLRVRKEDGIRYLDYLKDYPDTATQLIQFGSNLIEFTRNKDASEYATVLVPLGKRLDKSPIEALDAYTTVETVNKGSLYVMSDEAYAARGWIEKVVSWDEVSDPAELLEKAKEYLKDLQFENMELELNALDLHYLHANVEAVKLLDEIRVISRPHGLDRMFPVRKLEIPLDSPEQTQFTLGDTVQTSLTSENTQMNAAIMDRIDKLPKAYSLLKEARENATEIMNMATTGFITITRDEYGSDTLYISNTRDYTAADKLWKWNMNGLGYSNDGGKTWGLAITMDGAIVANYITAGVLNGDVIRTGVIQDPNSNVILDLTNGTLTMKKGSIDIGNGNFTVDEEGNLYARRGTFAGTLSGAKGTFGGVVQAEDYLDAEGNSMMSDGRFSSKYLDVRGLNVNDKLKIDENGNVTLDGGTIKWTSSNPPVKYQFSQYSTGPWHDTMQSSDKYRKDSLDGGMTWGDAYQFRGTDGKNGTNGANGSDASVTWDNILTALQLAANTKTSFITADSAGAPIIYGGKIYSPEIYSSRLSIQPKSYGDAGGIDLWGYAGSTKYNFLRIVQDADGTVSFYSPAYGYANWDFVKTTLNGTFDYEKGSTVDFTGATVKGLDLETTAVFG